MPSSKWCRSLIPALLSLAISSPWGAAARGEGHADGRPALGDHNFVETIGAPSPQLRSFVRNKIGAGKYYDISRVEIVIGDEEISGFQGSLLFLNVDFEYQYVIKPWVAARIRVVGAGRLGSDTLALLSDGLTMGAGYEIGWLVRLKEADRTALSLELGLTNRSFTGVNIFDFVSDVVEGVPAALVRKTPSIRGSAGLRFAWAANTLLGVTARGRTGYGESTDRSREDVLFWNLAASLDFDLRTQMPVPAGVAVGYVFDSFPEFSSDIAAGAHSVFLRFSYLGREDFLFSLDLSHDFVPLTEGRPDLKGMLFAVSLRYYI